MSPRRMPIFVSALVLMFVLQPSFLTNSQAKQVAGTATNVALSSSSVPALDHIFVVVMENTNYSSIVGNSSAPYINSLISGNALNGNYFALGHPSLPNYLALTGANPYFNNSCVTGDGNPSGSCIINANNIADSIENSNRSWKGYMESMPTACDLTNSSDGLYWVHHDPFVYYSDIQNNPSRCSSHVVPYTQLSSDLGSASTTPNLAWITPNSCNDMHNCSVSTGDTWLSNNLPAIFKSPAWTTQHSALMLVWDEDSSCGGCNNQVAQVVVSPLAKAGYTSTVSENHYSLLKTIEQSWGLPALNNNDLNATPMTDIWTSGTGGATNLLQNPSFDSGSLSPWSLTTQSGGTGTAGLDNTTGSDAGSSAKVSVTATGTCTWCVQFGQGNLSVASNQAYNVTFWAKASANRSINVGLQQSASPWKLYASQTFNLTTGWQSYTMAIPAQTIADNNTALRFNVAQTTGTVWLDNVSFAAVTPSSNLLVNGSFDGGSLSPWALVTQSGGAGTISLDGSTAADGSSSANVSVTVTGTCAWCVQVAQSNLALTSSRQYTVTFWAKASASRSITVGVQQGALPWKAYAQQSFTLGTSWQRFTFTVPAQTIADSNTALRFNVAQMTGKVWIDGVSLTAG